MDELDVTAAENKATYEEIREYVKEHTGLNVSNLYIAQVKRKCGIKEWQNYNKPKAENPKQLKCPPEKEKAIREALKYFKMVCWICLYFSPPFQSTRTARYSSHRRSGCHRPATPQCSSQCIRDRRCRCRSACSVCIFRRSSFVLLSSTGFLFLYILIITLLVAKVKFFPKKFCQKGT
jgi:hypothetical protein